VTAAYYNEIDPYAAQWLRNLIAAGHIAPGEVDERSILDVSPDDLAGFTQCHFFAGIGVWSHALRRGGWLDSSPVWTGSCPCQPFSVAGVGSGFDDERHLWPFWFHLIEQCRPRVVFGEQVEAAIRHGWLDLVQADMEGIGYAFAAAGVPAAGVGAPHIRQRLWFVANSLDGAGQRSQPRSVERIVSQSTGEVHAGKLAHDDSERQQQVAGQGLRTDPEHDAQPYGCTSRLGDDDHARLEGLAGHGDAGAGRPQPTGSATAPGAVNGFWADADWLPCRDGKWRPVEPGTFPLAHGAPARVGRLRAYGNAIVSEVAREFVAAYMECRP
jgi:DNA (cytosine-5)-methyltransferase 1